MGRFFGNLRQCIEKISCNRPDDQIREMVMNHMFVLIQVIRGYIHRIVVNIDPQPDPLLNKRKILASITSPQCYNIQSTVYQVQVAKYRGGLLIHNVQLRSEEHTSELQSRGP